MHYHRLSSNCEKLKIELPVDEYAFEHDLIKTINANRLKNSYVRVTVSPVGASVGIERPLKMKTNFVIFAKPLKERPRENYEKGARVIVVSSVFEDDPEMAEIKSTSYLTKMVARIEIAEKKSDEGLLINRAGLILEGSATNLFVVKDGILFTPPLTDGCLPGITRWVVMGLAEGLKLPCREASLKLIDLKKVDEIFMTGSTAEILPVREVVGVVKKTAPGGITRALMRAYKEIVLKKQD